MPSKSRSKKAEPRELSRTALLREYGITDKTLRRLTDSLYILDLPTKSGRGRVVYQVDGEADALLKLAGNCPDSFKGFRPPYLRFIMLGFLTMSDEDILAGLQDRGITNRSVTLDYLREAREAFIERLPPVIRKVVEKQDDPKTSAQVDAYDNLLRIIGIKSIYEHPDYLEDFYFENEDLLHFMNQVVWSHSVSDDLRANIVNHAAGYRAVSGHALIWYRSLLHDADFMRTTDSGRYFNGLPPRVRNAYRESLEISAEELVIRSELAYNTMRELHYFSRQLKAEVRRLLASTEEGASLEATKLMSTALKVDDAIGKLKPEEVGTELPAHIQEITPAQYDFDEAFKLPSEYSITRPDDESDVG